MVPKLCMEDTVRCSVEIIQWIIIAQILRGKTPIFPVELLNNFNVRGLEL